MARLYDVRTAAERTARASYGRLLAWLAARTHDVAAAEDALGDAFVAALEHWPRDGVPDRPDAWLLTAARRRLTDAVRHRRVRDGAAALLTAAAEETVERAAAADTAPPAIPDRRLELLFVCAHPAIDATMRTPLMLQTVLGLDAARIASAFLAAPAAMAQRLVRVKAKIRDAGIPFALPDERDLPARLAAVLEAIYAAYGSGWDDLAGADPRRQALTGESLWLARLLTELLPDAPEAFGLLALLLHCEARQAARRDAAGAYVPLAEQEVARWSCAAILEAERALDRAVSLGGAGRPGRFQLEAAIQSAHARRALDGRTDWPAIAMLYAGLLLAAPTLGAYVGRAAAVGEAESPAAGLRLLDEIPAHAVASYQPYWAARAHLLARVGQSAAADAYARAIGLADDAAVRAFLVRRRDAMSI